MTTPTRRGIRRLLDAPHLPVAIYLATIGITSLASSRSAALGALPWWLVAGWATSLIVGAGLVIWGVAGEHTRAESTGHMFHLIGLAFYALVHVSLIGGQDVIAVLVLATVGALRMRVLARSRAAKREAARILKGRS